MVYISDLKIVRRGEDDPPSGCILSLDGSSLDLNRGQKGAYAFIVCETSSDRNKAIYGVDVVAQDFEDSRYTWYAKDREYYLYIKPFYEPRGHFDRPITNVGLHRDINYAFIARFIGRSDHWNQKRWIEDSIKDWQHPRERVWRWHRAKQSADLNWTRHGEPLAIFMQFEDMCDDPLDSDVPLEAQIGAARPVVYLLSNATYLESGARGYPKFYHTWDLKTVTESTYDYKCRLTYVFAGHTPSLWLSWWDAAARDKIDEPMRAKLREIDADYQTILKNQNPKFAWNTEKHMRDAIADGY